MARGSWQEEWDRFVEHLNKGNSWIFAIVIILAPVNWFIESFKWRVLLQKIEKISFVKIFSSILTGKSFAMITPGKVGDFAGRILYLENKNKLKAIIATFIDNFAHTLVTFAFGLAGLVWLNIHYPGTWQLIILIACLLSSLILIYLYFRIELFAIWADKAKWLRRVIVAIRILKRYSKNDLLILLLLSSVRFCVYSIQFLILINILGASVPWIAGFFLTITMFWMIAVVPSILFADLGVRGYIGTLLFIQTSVAANSVSVLAGSYAIWFLNLVLPAVIGSFLILSVRIIR
jgi:hypothetical protein